MLSKHRICTRTYVESGLLLGAIYWQWLTIASVPFFYQFHKNRMGQREFEIVLAVWVAANEIILYGLFTFTFNSYIQVHGGKIKGQSSIRLCSHNIKLGFLMPHYIPPAHNPHEHPALTTAMTMTMTAETTS